VRTRRYFTLWASLPQLPHFTRADRLPINRQRLESRLKMLGADDYKQLYTAAPLLAWDREVVGRVDDQVARQYEAALPTLTNGTLRQFVNGQIENRTVLAALRRRQLGQESPRSRRKWGVGRRVRLERTRADHRAAPLPLRGDFCLHLQVGDPEPLVELRRATGCETLSRPGDGGDR
jgi:hypothetical protein